MEGLIFGILWYLFTSWVKRDKVESIFLSKETSR